VGRSKNKRAETRKGPLLLQAFLVRHSITLRAAATALKLKHPTIWQWLHRRAVPLPHLRKRLATWTGNEVPESSWVAASEAVEVEPFRANGTDE
jgi:hypothetical protein